MRKTWCSNMCDITLYKSITFEYVLDKTSLKVDLDFLTDTPPPISLGDGT